MNKISQTHTLIGYNFVLSKVFKTHSEYNTIFSKLKLYAKTKKQQHRKESCWCHRTGEVHKVLSAKQITHHASLLSNTHTLTWLERFERTTRCAGEQRGKCISKHKHGLGSVLFYAFLCIVIIHLVPWCN